MGLGIFRKGIMNVVGSHQFQPRLLRKAQQSLIYHFLLRYTMILKFQIKMVFPKDLRIS